MSYMFNNIYCCNVCKEEYTGKKRLWVCPTCGTADSFEVVDGNSDSDSIFDAFEDEYDDFN